MTMALSTSDIQLLSQLVSQARPVWRQWLHGELWDEIRRKLPLASPPELHVYGAHPTGAAQALNAPVHCANHTHRHTDGAHLHP